MFIVHTDQFVCIFIFFIDMGKIKKSGEIWENMYFGRGKSTLECALIFPFALVEKYFFTLLWQFFFINKKVVQCALLYTQNKLQPQNRKLKK
jgi:hypothetical protein